MAKPKATGAATKTKNIKAGKESLGLSLQELKKQIAAHKGKLILVTEKERKNGYFVYYQVCCFLI